MLHVQFYAPGWINLKGLLNTGLAKQHTKSRDFKKLDQQEKEEFTHLLIAPGTQLLNQINSFDT